MYCQITWNGVFNLLSNFTVQDGSSSASGVLTWRERESEGFLSSWLRGGKLILVIKMGQECIVLEGGSELLLSGWLYLSFCKEHWLQIRLAHH